MIDEVAIARWREHWSDDVEPTEEEARLVRTAFSEIDTPPNRRRTP